MSILYQIFLILKFCKTMKAQGLRLYLKKIDVYAKINEITGVDYNDKIIEISKKYLKWKRQKSLPF